MKARLWSMAILILVAVAALLLPIGSAAFAQSAGNGTVQEPSRGPIAVGVTGRWIEVDTSRGVAMAVEDGRVVYSALVTVGAAPWSTPKGYFTINRRVYSETMNSATIGIPLGSPGSYLLRGVMYTQYFYGGVAIHQNYWSPPETFGSAGGSHGCVGMMLGDAAFFWDFAGIGTPVIVY